LPELFLEIHSIFSLPVIFTPLELESEYNGTWPSIDQLSVSGKKVLFVTGADYGPVIDPIMFSKYATSQMHSYRLCGSCLK
jgi:hypothetical protein